MRTILGFLTLLVLLLVAAAALVWTGAYNFAATQPHLPLTERIIDFALKRSVAVRAKGIQVPPLADAHRVQDGARHYRDMCQPCHGAPGQPPAELAKGLVPEPPDLQKAVPRWSEAELFWIVKHGIKMTGMPAWGQAHDDQELWNIIAFLDRLPAMQGDEYRQLAGDGRHAKVPSAEPGA